MNINYLSFTQLLPEKDTIIADWNRIIWIINAQNYTPQAECGQVMSISYLLGKLIGGLLTICRLKNNFSDNFFIVNQMYFFFSYL